MVQSKTRKKEGKQDLYPCIFSIQRLQNNCMIATNHNSSGMKKKAGIEALQTSKKAAKAITISCLLSLIFCLFPMVSLKNLPACVQQQAESFFGCLIKYLKRNTQYQGKEN